MNRSPAEILKDALELPPGARVALANSLLSSLDREIDQDAEEAWVAEIERRLAELDSEAVKTVPWADVRRPRPQSNGAFPDRVPPICRR